MTVAGQIDALAQEIRRVDGENSLGAGALAEALMPFLAAQHRREAEAGGLRDALTMARAYVEQAVKDDGGIDNCEIGDRLALERIDAALAASPASGVRVKAPDIDMALHWIDRYAAGIDEEPQMSRILDALGVEGQT